MSLIESISSKLPGVAEPKTHLSFKTRLMWTVGILLLFLFLGQITLYGVEPTEVARLQFFELILGASIGTLMTLGIGPIVTASIILQLLVGAQIVGWDLKTQEGKAKFQGAQKLLALFFAFFEAYAYVAFGAIKPASPDLVTFSLLILQLAFGAIIVMFMDEVVSKWGIGSGISLFIAAGVTKQIFVRAFNPLTLPGETVPTGLIPQFFVFMAQGELFQAAIAMLPIIATIIVFAVVVYIQAVKVEIPLAFGSISGFGRRWPLNLIYTSNIPVILIAALIANVQLVGTLMAQPTDAGRCGAMGCFDQQGNPTSGFVYFLRPSADLSINIFFLTMLAVAFVLTMAAFYFGAKRSFHVLAGSAAAGLVAALVVTELSVGLPVGSEVLRSLIYMLIMVGGAVLFSVFWVTTSGMDARSVADQIQNLGMQIPGFRRDPRIVEQVLNRYIPVLAIMSGLIIGLIASVADFTNALGTGTGILLTVSIIYNFYEQISARYVEEMNPAVRKFFK
ncbi:MAG: preprotein translocase subunit SecY [Candidatus Aenigmarchaeota archaeon]|nr:preprotein translocase subunit SecY [Candidatus Aenigmarchaeota archaeon]